MWEFELVQLEKSQAAERKRGENWYRYTIANRITEINGTRRGSRAEVLSFVYSALQRLNNRHKTTSFTKR